MKNKFNNKASKQWADRRLRKVSKSRQSARGGGAWPWYIPLWHHVTDIGIPPAPLVVNDCPPLHRTPSQTGWSGGVNLATIISHMLSPGSPTCRRPAAEISRSVICYSRSIKNKPFWLRRALRRPCCCHTSFIKPRISAKCNKAYPESPGYKNKNWCWCMNFIWTFREISFNELICLFIWVILIYLTAQSPKCSTRLKFF